MSAVIERQAETTNKTTEIAGLLPLLREIANLKRIRAAHLDGSFAAQLFKSAWIAIVTGDAAQKVALDIAGRAIIGSVFGAIDENVLKTAELEDSAIDNIRRRSLETAGAAIDANLLTAISNNVSSATKKNDDVSAPQFVDLLIRQPRSGATKTGMPKLIFDDPENHAEHSMIVGIFAVLLAPVYDADVETVFFAALAHHFHNAYLPDSGFAGEEALDAHLPMIFNVFRRKCLAEIPENLHDKIRNALQIIETAETAEAQAFHAADVLDRVLQMRHHAEANEFTLRYAMEEAELVHAGVVQEFHYRVLKAVGLI